VAEKRPIDWKLIVAVVALFISVFAGSFWRTPDIVFDKRAVEIPLSDPLRKTIEDALKNAHSDSIAIRKNNEQISSSPHLPSAKLPDKLLYVDLRNVGHVPSTRIKVRIAVPGEIADKDVLDAGPAFGAISQLAESDAAGELSFECQNLANHPQAKLKIALWYQQTKSGSPTVDIQDISVGPAREVSSIETARFYWWEWLSHLTGPLTALAAFLASILTLFLERKIKRKRADVIAVYDPSQFLWAEAKNDAPTMQVWATASLSSTSGQPIEIVQAYLSGTKSATNLSPFLVAPETAVTASFTFFVKPLVVEVGKTYRGRVVLVDKYKHEYESEVVSIPSRKA